MPSWKKVIVSGSDATLNSLNVISGVTGSLLGTGSWAVRAQSASIADNAVTASRALQANTASYVQLAASSSFASTASFVNTLNQSVLITGSLTVGTSSLGSNENTLVLGPPPAGGNGEGGQLLLQSPNSGSYTSASMLDNWQNYTRLLRGSNVSSDAVVTQWNMHSKQISFPAYNSVSAFAGTAVANLAVDSGGNIITVSTSGGSVFPYTGVAQINGGLIVTGSITASNAIYAQANGAMYFRGGDDAELWDINVANTIGVYGQQDQTVASIKLGSGGGTISGRSGNIGVNTITPNSASLHVNGNVFATSFTGSLLGTATTASYVQNAASASYALSSSYALNASTATSASFATNASTAASATSANTASWATNVNTASWAVWSNNAVNATSATSANTASWATNVNTASWANNVVTASRALQANTASYATFAATATSATTATSASYATFAATASSGDAFYVRTSLGISRTPASNEEVAIDVPNNSYSIAFYSGSSFNYGLHTNNSIFTFATVTGSTWYFQGGNVGIGTNAPISKFQIGNNVYTAANGLAGDNNRIGMMLNGFLTSYVYSSVYNDPTYPDYGFVFIHGSGSGNNTNVWSISPDGPAKGSGLHLIYQSGSSNIHTQTPKVSFIGSSGNVGIGTSSPTAKIHVNSGFVKVSGTDTDQYFFEGVRTGTSTTLRIYDNSSVAFYDSYNTMHFRANQNGGSGGTILFNGGNVGIGTTAPAFKLETVGNTRISGNLSVGTTYNGFAANIEGIVYIINGSAWVNDGYGYANASSTNTGMFPSSTHIITFKNNNTTTMYINSSGNVGINTTNPTEKLHVAGNIKTTGTLTVSGSSVTIYNESSATVINMNSFYQFTSQNWNGRIITDYFGQTYTSSIYHGMSFVGGRAGLDHFRWFDSSYSELMTLRNSGNLLLGAGINPAENYWRLYIAGSTSGSIYVASGNSYFGGNIGINNTGLANRLTVNTPLRNDGETNSLGAAVVAGPITDSPSNDFTTSSAIFRIQGSNATNNLQFGVGNTGYNYHPWIQGSYDNSSGGSDNYGSKDILLNPLGGNVGIGTVNGTFGRLHVNGNVWATSFTGSLLGTASSAISASYAPTVLSGGTTNYITKWASSSTLTTSQIFDNGTNIGIFTATPTGSAATNLVQIAGANAVLRIGPWFATNDRDFIELIANGADTKITSPNERFIIQNTGGHILLDAAGNIGISTTAPAYKIQTNAGFVDGGSGYIATFHSNIGATGDTYVGIGAYRSDALGAGRKAYINAIAPGGGSGALILQTTGNYVGVNIISPSANLHVSGGSSTQFKVEGTEADLWLVSTGGVGTWRILGSTGGTTKRFRIYDNDNSRDVFNVYDNGNPIFPYGNVGIGTTAPAYTLEVAGNVGIGAGTSGLLAFRNTWTTGTVNRIRGYFGNDDKAILWYYDNSPAGTVIRDNNSIQLTISGSNGLYVNSSSNIGIGVSSPSFLLDAQRNTGAIIRILDTSTNNSLVLQAGSGNAMKVTGYNYNSSTAVPLYISVDGANTIMQSSGGNVGIGTTVPSSSVHIYTTDNAVLRAETTTGQAGVRLMAGDGTTNRATRIDFVNKVSSGTIPRWTFISDYNQNGTNDFRIIKEDTSTAVLTLLQGSKVGVVATAPIGQLQIGNNTFTGAHGTAGDNSRIGMMLNGSLTSYIYASTYNDPTYPDYGFIFIHGPNTSNYNVWSISPDGPAKGSGLHFLYGANSTNIHTATPKVSLIGSSGNVGIGNSTPFSKLVVATTAVNTISYDDESSTAGLTVAGTNALVRLQFGVGANTLGPYGGWIQASYDNGGSAFGIEPLLLNPTGGFVGINTNSPSQQLHVNGSTRSNNVAIGTGQYGNTIQAISDSNLNISASSGIYFVNGTSTNMILNSAGCLGIGTTAPSYRLEVQGGNIAANGGAIYVRSNPSVSWDFYKISTDGAYIFHLLKQASLRIQRNNTTDGGETSEGEVLYASAVDGNVGIGTITPAYTLDVSGTIRATGDVIAYSDARVKENVETITNALDKVTSLRGVTYTRKDIDDKSEKIGVIAQEVLEVLPQVVSQDDEGQYSVAYGNMAGVLIEAIKELKSQNDTLQSRIQQLESLVKAR